MLLLFPQRSSKKGERRSEGESSENRGRKPRFFPPPFSFSSSKNGFQARVTRKAKVSWVDLWRRRLLEPKCYDLNPPLISLCAFLLSFFPLLPPFLSFQFLLSWLLLFFFTHPCLFFCLFFFVLRLSRLDERRSCFPMDLWLKKSKERKKFRNKHRRKNHVLR